MKKIFLIGISSPELTKRQQDLLTSCSLVVAGKRLLGLCKGLSIRTRNITPLEHAFSVIDESLKDGNVAILASGDPLFFGIGKRIIAQFGAEVVEVEPALSSLQLAFARFKLPWDDAAIVSLHGRHRLHIPGVLLAHEKSFVFTDKENSPDRLTAQIIAYLELIGEEELLRDSRVMVAENLGASDERLYSGTLEKTTGQSFSDLNVMCLHFPDRQQQSAFGLREEDIAHSRGLITKDEIRAATLHRLALPRTGVFWDVGAGSGSISIETARMNPDLIVYAIERKDKELENIRANIRKYCCYNVIPVAGKAPDVLHALPDPHRVFIGGNGGHLEGIVREAATRLPIGGWLVANGVIQKTIAQAPEYMKACGLAVSQSTLSFSRTDESDTSVSFNPITIIAGGKFV